MGLLSELRGEQLYAVLDEPVDDRLNTLLHLAVQTRDVAVTKLLLKYGARSSLRNINGDTPTQWFMLPRTNAAALACHGHAAEFGNLCFQDYGRPHSLDVSALEKLHETYLHRASSAAMKQA